MEWQDRNASWEQAGVYLPEFLGAHIPESLLFIFLGS
ncbi:hypothetical protein LEMLEM_LOCUS2230 [Lemmus lemmus]